MAAPNYYTTLGVAETATPDEIKKAYRRLARENHPDTNAGDKAAEERFKGVQEAYDTLSDPEKRRTYDFRRKNPGAFGGGMPGGFGGGMGGDVFTGRGGRYRANADGTFVRADDPMGDDDGLFGDLLGRMFGGGGPSAPPPPRDIEADVRLSFEEALAGGRQEMRIGDETMRIAIPKGVANGTRIRVRGKGATGAGGRRGDLYLRFHVAPSPRFVREGDDLVVTETISAFDALLGTSRTVETPYGQRVKLRIPPGTQPGTRLRVRGKGIDRGEGKTPGDLFVELAVTVPTLTEVQREALSSALDAAGLA